MTELLVQADHINSSVSTSSTTLVTPSTTTSVSLKANTDYWIVAVANAGGNDAACESEIVLRVNSSDANERARGAGEGAGNSQAWNSFRMQSMWRHQQGGSDGSVEFRYRCITSSDTTFIGGQSIIAIPLKQPSVHFDNGDGTFTDFNAVTLIENQDYFYSGTDSSSAEASNISNTWTTVNGDRTFSVVAAGDYIVAFSCETWMTTGVSASDAHKVRCQIDGTTVGAGEYVREWETDNDRFPFLIFDITNLSAGSHTFRIQIQNRAANAKLNCGRTRMFAVRRDAFTQVVQTVDTSGVSFTNTSEDGSNIFLSTSVTSSATGGEWCVIATSNYGTSINNGALCSLRQGVGGTGFGIDAGDTPNNSGLGSDDDFWPRVMVGAAFSGGPNTGTSFVLQNRMSAAGTGTAGKNAGNTAGVRSNLIAIEGFIPELDPIMLSEAGGVVPFAR